jgi:quinol-cytochrome oxidoreductase complex cytochrome b subunit
VIGRLIDWLDYRLGIKEFHGKHIAFVLPESVSFWTLFGGLTIGCIFIQVVTGIYMVSYYVPVPELAHESIKAMCNTTTFGALFRNVHRYSATLGMFFLTIHMFHIIARRAYRPPRELNWWVGLMMAFVFILSLITGIIVPWDWRSYWELVIWMDWIDTIPLIGPILKDPLISNFTLGRNYIIHIFLLPALLFGFLFVHIIVMRRLGLSDRV